METINILNENRQYDNIPIVGEGGFGSAPARAASRASHGG